MSKEQITKDADTAVTYLNALLAKKVERADAVSMTASYMTTVVMARSLPQEPREPWEKDG